MTPEMPALAKILMDQDITVVNTFVQVSEKRGPRERRLLRSQTAPATAAAAEEVEEQFEGEGCEGYESDLVAQETSEKSVIEDCFGSASPKPRFWHSATPDRWEWDAMLQDLQEEGMSGPHHDGFIRQSSEKSVIEDCQEPEPSETMRMKLQSLRTQNVFDTPDVWELQAICESFGESPAEPALPLMDQDITAVNTFVQGLEKQRLRERRLLRSQTSPATAAAAEEVEEEVCESDFVAQETSEKSVIEDCSGSASPKPRFWHSATPDRWEWDAMLQDLQEEGISGPHHDGFIRQSSEKSVIEDCEEPEPSVKLQSLRTQNVFDTPDVWELQAICESFGESPAEPALPLMDHDITVVNTFVQGLEKQRLRERRLLRSQTSPATAAAAEASSKPRFWHSATPDRWEWDAMLQDLQEEGMSGTHHDGFIRQSSEKSVIEDCQEPEPSETMRMKLQSLRTQNVFDTPDVWELQAICESFGESPPEPALPSATSVASLVRSSTPDPWEWDAMLQDDKLCVPQPCMAPASLMPSVGAPLGPQSEYPRLLGSPKTRKPSMRPGMLETSLSEGQTLVKWCVDASKFSSNSGRLVSPDFQLHFPQQEPLTFRLMVIGGKNAGFKKAKGRGSLELKCFSAVPPGLQSITACVAIGAGESQRISPKPIKHNFVEKTCCQLRNGEEASWDFKKLTGDATICEIAVEIHL